MKNTNVVHLAEGWDMLLEWNRVRQAVAAGRVKGFQMTLLHEDGRETVYVGGLYKEDPRRAVSAALKMSMVRMLGEDPPLLQACE